MTKAWKLAGAAGAFLLAGPASAEAHGATADEVVATVQRAAALLHEDQESAIAAISERSGDFVWKDTYVFVVNCAADRVVANPAFPERVGGDIKQHTDYAGYRYGETLCETAALAGGGWVDYVWLRPGSSTPQRKSSFVIAVPDTDLTVGAGIYLVGPADLSASPATHGEHDD